MSKKNIFFRKIPISIMSIALSVISIAAVPVILIGNFTVDFDCYTYVTDKLTSADESIKIAHISDFHNNPSELVSAAVLERLKSEKPDIIAITGDFVDCHTTDVECSLRFAKNLLKIAPVYYVRGNHEFNLKTINKDYYASLMDGLVSLGVYVLLNEKLTFSKNGTDINIFGLDELYSEPTSSVDLYSSAMKYCKMLDINKDELNVLLAHHPEELPVYAHFNFDVVFSGHAHGGQVRLFGIGLVAPNQGIFPKYSSGMYKDGDTTMYLSRGLGNSVAPVRVFDRPHVIICTFSGEKA